MHGFSVTLCDGGKSLRKAIAREMPDLIVLDLNMPEEDGFSIVRDLEAAARTIPVIMLTATASPIDRVVGLELGADDYLAKPANCASCWRASARCCGGARPQAGGAAAAPPRRTGRNAST